MAEMKKVREFAVKWYRKFKDPKINYLELVDHFMADDCAALGFEMDCGHAFSEKYGKATNDFEAWSALSGRSPIFRCSARLFTPNGDISITGHIPARKF